MVVVVVAALLRGVAVAFPLLFAAAVVLVTRPHLVRLAGVGVGASAAAGDEPAAGSSSSSLRAAVGVAVEVPPVVGVGVVAPGMVRYFLVIWPKRVCEGGVSGGTWGLDGGWGLGGRGAGGLGGWHRCCG